MSICPRKSRAGANRRPSSAPSALLSLQFLGLCFLLFGCTRQFEPATSRAGQTVAIHAADDDDNVGVRPLPPLSELIDGDGRVIGDISWMLDFAIIGFPKAGTTFMKDHLNRTNETYVYDRELCMKKHSDVSSFVTEYYDLHVKLGQNMFPKTVQFGLKCPGVFYRADDVRLYEEYFPHTKFIVGLRHPVSWFESFYNYQAYRNVSLPRTSRLVGRCAKHQKVCTDRARMHAGLARLGKTPMADDDELGLLFGTRYDVRRASDANSTGVDTPQQTRQRRLGKQRGLTNQVLLYEVRQIHDSTSDEFLSSIGQYLGLQESFPPIQTYKQNKTRTIDICQEEHADVRQLLVDHGTDAAIWIQKYFLRDSSVRVASSDSFTRYLRDWSTDPCVK